MDKRTNFSKYPEMENNATNQESDGDLFVHRVTSSGLVLKFKVDKNRTLAPEYTSSSQEVRSSRKQNSRHPIDNIEANYSQSVIPLMEQSEISNTETKKNKIIVLDQAKVARPSEKIYSASVVVGGVNETSSSENAKTDDTENVITTSWENREVTTPENGSTYRSAVHTCGQCGKSFKQISSLNGHMGGHRREDYKPIRTMPEQPIQVQVKQGMKERRELRHTRGASQALVEMSAAYVWHPKHGTSTIDLSASMTCSETHSSGETAEMRDAAEFLATLVKRVGKYILKAPSASSIEGFMCRICNKSFSSFYALGGHMSIHNKTKKSLLLEDRASSTSHSTWKFVCCKCNQRFPTGQSLGGHKRKHWFEEHKMAPFVPAIMKPPLLSHETEQWSRPVVLPTDENMQPPVLLASDTVQPTGPELEVAKGTVPLAYDAFQQPQKMQGNLTEADLPAAMGVPSSERCVFDLN